MSSAIDYLRANAFGLRALFVAVVIATSLGFLWNYSQKTERLLCEVDCGETALAVHAAEGFREYGFRYWLVENLGTTDRPAIYTHNVNLGGLFFVFLDVIGVRDFESKQLAVLGIFGLGLLYAFLLVQLVSRSFIPAAITLVLMASTYWVVTAFAMNALRAWHFVALFGVGYHLSHCLMMVRPPFPKIHVLGLTFAAFVAFGCGYDFWVICGAFALTLTAFRAIRYRNHKEQIYCLILIFVLFTFPFIARQIQVIGALGADYWLQDVIFSIGIKIPGAAKLVDLPPISEIEEFYRAHNVFRPPAFPSNDFLQIFFTMRAMVESVTVPRWGLVSLLMLMLVLGFGIYAVAARRPLPVLQEGDPVNFIADLLLPLFIAITFGLAIFSPFSLHVYLKHEFPLLAAPILLAKTVVIWWLIRLYCSSNRALSKILAVSAVIFLIVDAAILQYRSNNNGLASNLRWAPFVSKNLDAKYLFSTYYISIKALDPTNYKYIAPPDHKAALALLRDAQGKGTQNHDNDFSRYDYWVHQPLDKYYFFDSQSPTCDWNDWLMSASLDWLSWRKPKLYQTWIDASRASPGSIIFFGGALPRSHRNARLVVENQRRINLATHPSTFTLDDPGGKVENFPVELRYNCIYRTVVGKINLQNSQEGNITFDLVSILPSGKRHLVHRYNILIDARAPHVDRSEVFKSPPPPQISIGELENLLPPEAIAEKDDNGIGYLIVDLKKLREIKGRSELKDIVTK